jgi:hypothetical protein
VADAVVCTPGCCRYEAKARQCHALLEAAGSHVTRVTPTDMRTSDGSEANPDCKNAILVGCKRAAAARAAEAESHKDAPTAT